jgi:L-arabinose isomerase
LAETELNKDKALLTSILNFNVRKNPEKRYIWSILVALYRAETLTLRKVNQKYLRSFEMLLEDGNQLNQAPGVAISNLFTQGYTHHQESQVDRCLSLRCN